MTKKLHKKQRIQRNISVLIEGLREELSFKPSLYYCGMQMRRIALFIRLYGLHTVKIKEFCWLDNVDVNISD